MQLRSQSHARLAPCRVYSAGGADKSVPLGASHCATNTQHRPGVLPLWPRSRFLFVTLLCCPRQVRRLGATAFQDMRLPLFKRILGAFPRARWPSEQPRGVSERLSAFFAAQSDWTRDLLAQCFYCASASSCLPRPHTRSRCRCGPISTRHLRADTHAGLSFILVGRLLSDLHPRLRAGPAATPDAHRVVCRTSALPRAALGSALR